jgi:hypothetical protein
MGLGRPRLFDQVRRVDETATGLAKTIGSLLNSKSINIHALLLDTSCKFAKSLATPVLQKLCRFTRNLPESDFKQLLGLPSS